MQRPKLAFTIVALLALGPVAAQQQDADRPTKKKSDKKHVTAVLTDVPATPVPPPTPAPTPTPTAAAESSAPGAAGARSAASAATAPRDASTAPPATDTTPAAADTAARDRTSAPDTPTFEERIEVTEVQLDAIVRDQGKVVTGLGPQDFVVTEDGRPVEVTSARFYGAPEQLEATGEGEVERADRYFILLFHDRSRDATVVRPLLLDAGQQARKWAEDQRLPNDQVAVMTYDVRLKIYTDFTRDQQQIVDAISQAVASKKEPDRGAGRSKEPLRPMPDSPSLLLNLPAGDDLARATRVFEKTLALLGRAAEGIVGRKNLMLFSVGFGDVDPSGIWVPDTRYYPSLERNLNDGNVAVYAIDLSGSRRGAPAGPGIASSLASIAGDTAGLYYESFTTFATPMKEVSKDTAGYYLLSYRSEYPRGTSGYREVKVDTREKGYEVRARKGYLYGAKDEPTLVPDEDPDEEAPEEPPTGRG
jgi:VWFA-related protein